MECGCGCVLLCALHDVVDKLGCAQEACEGSQPTATLQLQAVGQQVRQGVDLCGCNDLRCVCLTGKCVRACISADERVLLSQRAWISL